MEVEASSGQRFLLKDDGGGIAAFCYGRHGEYICYMAAADCRALAAFLNTAADNLEKYGRVTEPEPEVKWDRAAVILGSSGGKWYVQQPGCTSGVRFLLNDGSWTREGGNPDSYFHSRWLAEAALAKATADGK